MRVNVELFLGISYCFWRCIPYIKDIMFPILCKLKLKKALCFPHRLVDIISYHDWYLHFWGWLRDYLEVNKCLEVDYLKGDAIFWTAYVFVPLDNTLSGTSFSFNFFIFLKKRLIYLQCDFMLSPLFHNLIKKYVGMVYSLAF